MLSSEPPPLTGATQRPPITDAKSCRQWLDALPLSNTAAAHAEVALQLDLLNHSSALSGIERLRILELLREPVRDLQEGMAKKYIGKPVPLDEAEEAVWKKVVALWAAMSRGYKICLQNFADNDHGLKNQGALLYQRALRLTGVEMLERYRVYRDIPVSLWKQLHRLFAAAEAAGLAKTPVKDPLNRMVEGSSPEGAYVQALLLDFADPFHLNARQIDQIDRWLDKWAGRVNLLKAPAAPPRPDVQLPALVTDLERGSGLAFGTEFDTGPSVRHLDTTLLAATLIKRIRHLRKGGAPADLDVGSDCVQPACEQALTRLYQAWCEPMQPRAYERRKSDVKAQVSFTVAAIHFFCNGGKPLRQPGGTDQPQLSWREAQDFQMFGHVSANTQRMRSTQRGFAAESWQIEDECALGFRLTADGLRAARLTLNQLIAVRHPQAPNFAIGHIRWMRFEGEGGDLHIGVRTFPGIPMAVGIRAPVLIPSLQNKFQPAFLLPEIPAVSQPASLVLPKGWYAPSKHLELQLEQPIDIRLTTLLDHGADFDRVRFELKH